MSWVMILRGDACGQPLPFDGQYLEDFDFEAHDGQGEITMTPDVARAKRFADIVALSVYHRRQPKCRPYRDDGLCNRPLTATNWECVNFGEAA